MRNRDFSGLLLALQLDFDFGIELHLEVLFVVVVLRVDMLWQRTWHPHWILEDHEVIVGGPEELDQLADVWTVGKVNQLGGLRQNMRPFGLVEFGMQKYLQRVCFFLEHVAV